MATSPSKKTVHYRKARFSNTSTQTLQRLVTDALRQQTLIRDRLEAIGAAPDEFRLISAFRETTGFLCGRLVTFERGKYQTAIADNPEATTLSLSAVAPNVVDGIPHQFVPGVLYFCLIHNHIAVIQSPALRVTALEQHLLWLLRSKTAIMAPAEGFVLADEYRAAIPARIQASHVKSIMLGRPFMEHVTLNAPVVESHDISTRLQPTGPITDFVKSLVDPGHFERLNMDSIFEGDLEVWIEIRYPKRARSNPQDAVALLDNLAIAMRDFDEDQVRLTLADGSIVKGNDLKISAHVNVSARDGVLDDDEVYLQLTDWLESQLRNHVVTE